MIHRHPITEEQAKSAISHGDFGADVIGSGAHVAIILTQDWCGQWRTMQSWIESLEKPASPMQDDVEVFELVYNTQSYGEEFRRFKERAYGNRLIPYVRYYVDGKYIGDSNYVTKETFLRRFFPET